METVAETILDCIKRNPGASRQDIDAALPAETSKNTISGTVRRLREWGLIENRGGFGNRYRPAKWYPVEIAVEDSYRTLAKDILRELKDLPSLYREDYLAQRLQELFS